MTTIRQKAKAYTPKQTKNISDLKEVSTELDINETSFMNKDGEKIVMQVIEVNGEEYRVPDSVVKQLKELISEMPGLTKFKVKKSGEGLKTSYTVIPLD